MGVRGGLVKPLEFDVAVVIVSISVDVPIVEVRDVRVDPPS